MNKKRANYGILLSNVGFWPPTPDCNAVGLSLSLHPHSKISLILILCFLAHSRLLSSSLASSVSSIIFLPLFSYTLLIMLVKLNNLTLHSMYYAPIKYLYRYVMYTSAFVTAYLGCSSIGESSWTPRACRSSTRSGGVGGCSPHFVCLLMDLSTSYCSAADLQ